MLKIERRHLTHAELATLAGTSRPTVSIALGEFEDENLITRSEGKLQKDATTLA